MISNHKKILISILILICSAIIHSSEPSNKKAPTKEGCTSADFLRVFRSTISSAEYLKRKMEAIEKEIRQAEKEKAEKEKSATSSK